jgi:MATE family multidrug resistance protein
MTIATDQIRPGTTLLSEMRRIAGLSLPIVISLAAATLIGVIDTIMIAPLGTLPLAAASITTFVLIIFYSGLYGFVSAIGVRMAEAHGKAHPESLSQATTTGLWIGLVSGTVGMVLMLCLRPVLPLIGQPPEVVALVGGYWTAMAIMLVPFTVFYALKGLFDAIDAPWIGVGLAFLAVALNVPANLVLIHGIGGWDGFGLLGAGLASLISQTVSLALAWIIWRRAALTKVSRLPVARSPQERRIQLKEGTTIAVGYVGEGGAYACTGLMMGWIGATALAANQIVNAVAGVLYMVPLGVSIAVSIRIGQAIGAGNRHRLRRIGLAALGLIIGWMTVVMSCLLLTRGWLTKQLSNDPEVIGIATGLFLVVAAMQVADGVQGTMLGAARGMTDNTIPVAITMVCYWVIALPAAYMLGFVWDWGPSGIWIGYGLGLAFAATAVTTRFFIKASAR